MKHNEHVMVWLSALRDEAQSPSCALKRIIEIAGIVARYAYGAGTV
ncbi:hypothetical protein HX878_31610 [Pseudomonas veronii]|nr:hypothetical protein [Pseudomonas veronii]NWD59258.1 hypothetical protein [Pseudomonas veronii]